MEVDDAWRISNEANKLSIRTTIRVCNILQAIKATETLGVAGSPWKFYVDPAQVGGNLNGLLTAMICISLILERPCHNIVLLHLKLDN